MFQFSGGMSGTAKNTEKCSIQIDRYGMVPASHMNFVQPTIIEYFFLYIGLILVIDKNNLYYDWILYSYDQYKKLTSQFKKMCMYRFKSCLGQHLNLNIFFFHKKSSHVWALMLKLLL